MSQNLRLLTVQIVLIDEETSEHDHGTIIETLEKSLGEFENVKMVDWEVAPAKVVIAPK